MGFQSSKYLCYTYDLDLDLEMVMKKSQEPFCEPRRVDENFDV